LAERSPAAFEEPVMQWEETIYDFPEDGWGVLQVMLDALPNHLEGQIIWVPMGGYRLQVENPVSAVFLRMAVAGLGVPDEEHPFLEEGELYVPEHLRVQCEQCLAMHCREDGAWSTLIVISTASETARIEWDGIYRFER
jgi:hypothetical protein